ncbi:hypothetical protein FRC09_011816 [Ceratobasidium sp. 395]|nr:hypothetical protein FRC09_011816 [Ceratobasidium sp. 395]
MSALIERRLLALGYGVKEEDLPRKRQGTWRGFFNRVDPFTETKWDQLQRHLIDFLEAETKERPGDGQKRCRSSRDSALRERFKYLRRAIDTLPDRPDGLSAVRRAAIMVDWLPLPGYEDTLEWPTIQTLLEADISVREAVDGFNKHREEITQMALDWGKRIKRGWADVLREGRKLEGLVVDPPRPRLSIDEAGADTDPFKGIDTDTSLLLRADSLFQPQNRPELYSYEELARHMDSNFGRGRSTLDRIKYLTFASTASKIAQALLMSLNHSDGSSVEFNSGPCRWFRCGRCHSSKMDWHEMIRHYIHMAENWEKAQARLPKLSKLGIAYNNVHDLESVNPKRLLTQLSAQEAMDVDTRLEKLEKMLCIDQVAEELRESSLPTNQAALTGGGERIDHPGNEDEDEDVEDVNWEQEDWDQVFFRCTLCRKGGLDEDMLMFTTIPDMFDHLRNVHNVSDPQRSIVLGNLNSMMRSPYFGLDLWD